MDYTLPVHWWLLLLFSLTYYHLSSFHIVLSPSVTSLPLPLPPCFHSSTCNSVVYLLLHRPQARDDLRFLADGLAGELLQHCHDHQAGGGGQGRFPSPLSCDLFSRLWRWMERWILKFPLSRAIYSKSCSALFLWEEMAAAVWSWVITFYFGGCGPRSELWCLWRPMVKYWNTVDSYTLPICWMQKATVCTQNVYKSNCTIPKIS